MKHFKFLSQSPEDTVRLGKRLAAVLKPGDIVFLRGDLGAGKTTLVKGIAGAWQIPAEKVHSPTFVLMNHYPSRVPIYHFDFYRLNSPDEIAAIGYEEFLYGRGVALIEWPEKFGSLAPGEHILVDLRHAGESQRECLISAKGKDYQARLAKLGK